MASLNDIETKIQRIIDKLSTKTITGTLPLTFTTHTAGNADDWSISGNNNVGYNILPSAAAETKTSGNMSVTCDGNGCYTINKLGAIADETSVYFEIEPINIPQSIGNGGGGCISLFNDQTIAGTLIRFYNNDTLIDFISLSTSANRQFTTYTAPENKKINKIAFRTAATSDTSVMHWNVKPMVTNDGTAPADFEPYQLGEGKRTKNIFSGTISQGGWGATGGTVAKNTSGQYYGLRLGTDNVLELNPQATYTIKAFSSSSKILQVAIITVTANMEMIADTGWGDAQTITGASYAVVTIRLSDNSTITVDDLLGLMSVKGSTAPSTYVPYGYEIPISVNGTPQTFYIGDSPLTEGETISKSSTGIDIELFEGENTVSTTLYNKPEMTIKYKYNGGN